MVAIYPIDKWPVTNLYVKLKATEVNSILDGTGKTSIDNCFLTLNSKGVISEQLLNEAEKDVKNCAERAGCYPSRLRAEVEKIPRDLHNSSHTKTSPNLKMLRPLCNHTVNLKTDSKTLYYSILKLK